VTHWKRNLWIIWFCQFLAILGMSMVVPFLPFYIREVGVTDETELTRWSGWIFAGPFLLMPFSSPFWGMIGDKHGRKVMVVRAIFGLAISQIFIATANSPMHIFLGRLIQGAFGGFIGAALALISTRTPKENLGYALSILQTATAAGALAGPFFGGLIADWIDYRSAFLVVGSLCLISGGVVLWKVDEHPASLQGDEPEIKFMDRYHFLWHSRELRWCLLIGMVSSAATCAVLPVFALFVQQLMPGAAYISTKTGLIVSIGALAMMLCSRAWGRRCDRHLYRSNVLIGSIMAAVMLASQGLAGRAWQLAPLHFLESAFFCGISISIYSLISRRTDEKIRGGVLSVISSFQMLGILAGPLAGSFLASHFGIPAAFFFAASLLAVVCVMSLRLSDNL
jgi:MFS family permease